MNKKIKYSPISIGHIIASWHIIFLLSRHKRVSPEKAYNILTTSGKLGGSLPAQKGIEICLRYKFIYIENGNLFLTKTSEEILIPLCDKDDPNRYVLRAILKEIVSCHNFEWLIFYDSDSYIFKEYLYNNDPEWVMILDNAKLFDFDDKEALVWWEEVLFKYENFKDEVKKAIGDIGEILTYEHEINRIHNDGHHPAKSYVKWAARISNSFGYDILSIKGKRFSYNKQEKDKIQIEVKASEISNLKTFRFYVSKPEWQTALKNIDNYYFYCWPGINLEKETALGGPYIISAKELVVHMPYDISIIAEWSECRCVLDISNYKAL